MKYSFVLIAFNEVDNIANCIASITKQQSLGNEYEILVIDDGSKDGTPSAVKVLMQKDHHIQLIGDGKNHGRGFGRNLGVKKSSGDFVIMVDADIILPDTWLTTVLPYMKTHDVAGGIAVPDGDVAYVFRRFGLQPKTVMGSTTITGNNGIYKSRIFSTVNFNARLREGEDVDFNHQLVGAGFTSICVSGLTVEHQEHKSFLRSMQWLCQSGIGATRQLILFKEIRLPDIAFTITLLTFIAAIILGIITGDYRGITLPILCTIGISFTHLRGKFHITPAKAPDFICAVAVNTIFIACYNLGRFLGFFVFAKTRLTNADKSAADGASA